MNTISRKISFPEPKLMKKCISIHSEDRDIVKYKSPSEFTIYLPDPITNICSVRVKDMVFPKLFIFSEDYNNTKMTLKTNEADTYEVDLNNVKQYSVKQILLDINTKLNGRQNIREVGDEDGFPPFPPFMKTLYYHSLSNKFIFTGFSVSNSDQQDDTNIVMNESVKLHQTDDPNVIDLKTHWGLGYYLGFDKSNDNFDYFIDKTTINDIEDTRIMYNKTTHEYYPKKSNRDILFLTDGTNENITLKKGTYILPSNRQSRIHQGRRIVYMEIDGLNSMDEIDPISDKAQFYKTNSAITKIQVPEYLHNEDDVDQSFLSNKTEFKTPIDKLYKCSFRFRFHDGTLVDFQGNDLSFTLEFEYLS